MVWWHDCMDFLRLQVMKANEGYWENQKTGADFRSRFLISGVTKKYF